MVSVEYSGRQCSHIAEVISGGGGVVNSPLKKCLVTIAYMLNILEQ